MNIKSTDTTYAFDNNFIFFIYHFFSCLLLQMTNF